MARLVSPSDYGAVTRMARIIVMVVYFVAGILVGISIRGLDHPGHNFLPGLIGAIIITNTIIWLFSKFTLPRIQLRLDAAIAARDGGAFERQIIKREMTRLIQPFGGIALTIGVVVTVIVLRQWR